MKIGLIADSHVPSMGRELPPQVGQAFADVDLILHAGDIFVTSCLDELEQMAPVAAVEYPPAAIIEDPRVESLHRIVHAEGLTIGLVHAFTSPAGGELFPGTLAAKGGDWTMAPHLEALFGEPVDIVVFGDTHFALVEEHQGILFVNPGSPTLPSQRRQLGTVGVLELDAGRWSAEIIDLRTLV